MVGVMYFDLFVSSGWLRGFEPSPRVSTRLRDYSGRIELSFSRGQKGLL
jgi:hypothetical protein